MDYEGEKGSGGLLLLAGLVGGIWAYTKFYPKTAFARWLNDLKAKYLGSLGQPQRPVASQPVREVMLPEQSRIVDSGGFTSVTKTLEAGRRILTPAEQVLYGSIREPMFVPPRKPGTDAYDRKASMDRGGDFVTESVLAERDLGLISLNG